MESRDPIEGLVEDVSRSGLFLRAPEWEMRSLPADQLKRR